MRRLSTQLSWIVGVVGVFCLAITFFDLRPRRELTAAPGAVDARRLSNSFREVAAAALPSIVAIETRGKAAAMNGLDPDDEENPLNELFKQNPQFREFFRERPRQREAPKARGMGSGFIIDAAGIILTNSHVVRGADEVKVRLYDGQDFVATEVKMDDNSDIAVLRIKDAKNLRALRLGDSDSAEIGDWVLAVGNPFDVGMTVTAGIISAKSRGLGIARREDFLQTDAAINPGNSGGPLLNLDGDVIGINTAISSRSGGSEGIGFAIPVNMVKWISQQLITHGKVRRAYLGIQIQPLTSALAKSLKIDGVEGALIARVGKDSPAADAKLQEGDVILELNGRKVATTQMLQAVVERLEIGKTYKALIVRDGQKLDVPIIVREMPENFLAGGTPPANGGGRGRQGQQPKEESFNALGLQVKELTDSNAKELGYQDKVSGVLVSGVDPNGPAAQAGISAGQVIEKVGGKKIASLKEFEEALKAASLKDGVTLLVSSPTGKYFVVVQSDTTK
jgi:serine protease Do